MTESRMQDCIFCKIARHEIDASVVFENDGYIAFPDIHPKAATHVLVVPKEHIVDLDDATKHPDVWKGLWEAVLATAKELEVLGNAKLQLHSGQTAGQEIPHLHVHILSNKDTSP